MNKFEWTAAQATAVNDFLMHAMVDNHKCMHCIHNYEGICFKAFECFLNDFNKYDDEDDD